MGFDLWWYLLDKHEQPVPSQTEQESRVPYSYALDGPSQSPYDCHGSRIKPRDPLMP